MRLAWLALLMLAPLASSGWELNVSGATVTPKWRGCAVKLPAGWNYDAAPHAVLASYDGPLLNYILVQLRPHKDAFKAIKKVSSAESLPEDLAEFYVANLRAEGVMREVEVLGTEPATLAGQAAFRLHLRYRLPENSGSAVIEEIAFGTPTPKALLLVKYAAPTLHFFARSLSEFEDVAKSVTLQ